jgi:endo-alpha-1,4-polygalactosaminidase (GH114 family)
MGTPKICTRLVVMVLLSATLTSLGATAASAAVPSSVRLDTLAPDTLVDVHGRHRGDVSVLADRDQHGTAEDPAASVRLHARGRGYVGYRTYTVPNVVSPSDVTTIALAANFRGPAARATRWTWSIHDVANGGWVRLGDQDHCGGDAGTDQWPCDDLTSTRWKYVRYNSIHDVGRTLADFVDPATREVRIRIRASDAGAARLDWESLEVYSQTGVGGPPWTPAVGARWQWQLEGRGHEDTGGIKVGICSEPFGGGACVRPQVFDIDLFVDPKLAGRFGYVVNTDAVDAIHASGRHVIGYVTAGDAERWRPDYEQYVDFDRRCGGCLLGNPFSRRFPDEYWASFAHGRSRFSFMTQMLRARTDRVAAAGFDGIEYDIVDTYAQGARYVGFRVDADTQLRYNMALADMAHEDGLSVALKNDGGQIQDLLPSFDYAINEQCFQYDECDGGGYAAPAWRAFIAAGKPVFQAEYRLEPRDFCRKANRWGFSSIVKARDYSLFAFPWTPCA